MDELEIRTRGRAQLVDVTGRVRAAVAGSGASPATGFVPHPTAGIEAVGEWARHAAADLGVALERLVDEDGPWRHAAEGDRNPSSHLRAGPTAGSATVPVAGDDLVPGDHRAIFLCESDGRRTRRPVVVPER